MAVFTEHFWKKGRVGSQASRGLEISGGRKNGLFFSEMWPKGKGKNWKTVLGGKISHLPAGFLWSCYRLKSLCAEKRGRVGLVGGKEYGLMDVLEIL